MSQSVFLHTPHVGRDLREHSFHRSRAAHKGRVDAVSGDGPRLLTHFRNLKQRKQHILMFRYTQRCCKHLREYVR